MAHIFHMLSKILLLILIVNWGDFDVTQAGKMNETRNENSNINNKSMRNFDWSNAHTEKQNHDRTKCNKTKRNQNRRTS